MRFPVLIIDSFWGDGGAAYLLEETNSLALSTIEIGEILSFSFCPEKPGKMGRLRGGSGVVQRIEFW